MVRIQLQKNKNQSASQNRLGILAVFCGVGFVSAASFSYVVFAYTTPSVSFTRTAPTTQVATGTASSEATSTSVIRTPLDVVAYDKKMLAIANYPNVRMGTTTHTSTSTRNKAQG